MQCEFNDKSNDKDQILPKSSIIAASSKIRGKLSRINAKIRKKRLHLV